MSSVVSCFLPIRKECGILLAMLVNKEINREIHANANAMQASTLILDQTPPFVLYDYEWRALRRNPKLNQTLGLSGVLVAQLAMSVYKLIIAHER